MDVIVIDDSSSDDVEDVTPPTSVWRGLSETEAYATAVANALAMAAAIRAEASAPAFPPKKIKPRKKKETPPKRPRTVTERDVTTGDSATSAGTTPAASPTRTPPPPRASRKSAESTRPIAVATTPQPPMEMEIVDLRSSSEATSEGENMVLTELAKSTSKQPPTPTTSTTSTTASPVRKRQRLRRFDGHVVSMKKVQKKLAVASKHRAITGERGRRSPPRPKPKQRRPSAPPRSMDSDSGNASDESLSEATSSGMESLGSRSRSTQSSSEEDKRLLPPMRARQVPVNTTARKSAPRHDVFMCDFAASSSSDEAPRFRRRTQDSARAAIMSPAESMITSGPSSTSTSPARPVAVAVALKSTQRLTVLSLDAPAKRAPNRASTVANTEKPIRPLKPLSHSAPPASDAVRVPRTILDLSRRVEAIESVTETAVRPDEVVTMDLCSSSDESVAVDGAITMELVNDAWSHVAVVSLSPKANEREEGAHAPRERKPLPSQSRRARARAVWKGPIPVSLLGGESIRPFENVLSKPLTHFDSSGELQQKCAFLATFGQTVHSVSVTYSLEAPDLSAVVDDKATERQVRGILEQVLPVIQLCKAKRANKIIAEARLSVRKNLTVLAEHRTSLLETIFGKLATSDVRRKQLNMKRGVVQLKRAPERKAPRVFQYQGGDERLVETRIGECAKTLIMPKVKPLSRSVTCITLSRNFRVDDDPMLSYMSVQKAPSDEAAHAGAPPALQPKSTSAFDLQSSAMDDEVAEYAMRAVVTECGDRDPVFEVLKNVAGLSQPYADYSTLKKLYDATALARRHIAEAKLVLTNEARVALLKSHVAFKTAVDKSLAERLTPPITSFDSHTVRWHVEQRAQSSTRKARTLNVRRTRDYNVMMESYRDFFCRICYCYDCQEHGIEQPQPRRRVDPTYPTLRSQKENVVDLEESSASDDDASDSDASVGATSDHSDNEQRRRSKRSLTVVSTTATSNWELQEQRRSGGRRRRRQRPVRKRDDSEYLDFSHGDLLAPRMESLVNENVPCSSACWKAKVSNDEERPVDDDATIVLITKLALLFGDNACVITAVMNAIPCCRVHRVLQAMAQADGRDDWNGDGSGRSRRVKSASRGQGWTSESHRDVLDRTRSHRDVEHSNNHAYEPCNHDGPCVSTACACIRRDHNCEKACSCPRDCRNRFRGCNCSPGACRTAGCPCVAAGRECDPDLCNRCGASEVALFPFLDRVQNDGENAKSESDRILSRSHRDGVSPYELCGRPATCANVHLQRGARRKIAIGASGTHGWGAFAATTIQRGDFICEYPGELISQDEAERRGLVYDKVATSYLFDLNEDAVVDAIRMANKSRFINHEPGNPNCNAKVVRVGAEHRITIWAKRDIQPDEELYFDYGFKPECAPQWSRVGPSKETANCETGQ